MKRGYPKAHQSGGPLVTNHLQDLEMELELLKRKRLNIERQQQMLSNDRFESQRNQPQYDQHPNYGQNRNFSHLYDDARPGGSSSQFGQNYQSVAPSWEPPPSNQYIPQATDNRGFSSNRIPPAYKSKNITYYPNNKNYNQHNNQFNKGSFNNSQQKGNDYFNNVKPFKVQSKFLPANNRPNTGGPVKKKFKPKKVSKAKNKADSNAPNNLGQKPVETRKELIEKAAPLSIQQENDWVLLPNRQPPAYIWGRMELAVSTILDALRKQYPEHSHYLETMRHRRAIKIELRVRLTKVLLGKVMPQVPEIHKLYRKEFPKETDRFIFNICRDLDDVRSKKRIQKNSLYKDNPEKFFKLEYYRLYERQINSMLKKLTTIQHKNDKSGKSIDNILKDLPDIYSEEEYDISDDDTSDDDISDDEVAIVKSSAGTDNRPAIDEPAQVEPAQVEPDQAAPDQPALDQAAPDQAAPDQAKPDQVEPAKVDTSQVESADSATDKSAKQSFNLTKENKPNIRKSVISKNKGVKQKRYPTNNTFKKKPYKNKRGFYNPNSMDNINRKTKYYRKLIKQLMERSLPVFLRQKKKEIIEILEIDKAYRISRACIVMEANEIAGSLNKLPLIDCALSGKVENHTENQKTQNLETDTTQKKPENSNRKITHFVKVVGKPTLPDKKIMKAFIDTFNPKSIKKHKFINNLLFIGFSCQADVDKILSANGTTIGNETLTISVSDKFQASNKGDTNNDPENTSADLENNIQLLSTIRDSEENFAVNEEAHEGDMEMTSENNKDPEKFSEETESANDACLSSIKEEIEPPINAENAEAVASTEKSAPAEETVVEAETEAKK